AKKHNLQPNELPRDVAPQFRGDERMEQGAKAFAFLHWLGFYRQLTNFTHFYDCSAAEAKPETVAARKALSRAERELKSGPLAVLKEDYGKALEQWRKVLEDNAEFRRDGEVQSSTYETQYNFLREWLRSPYGSPSKQALLAEAALARLAAAPLSADAWLALAEAVRPTSVTDPMVEGVFDGKMASGEPYVPFEQRQQVRVQQGLIRPPAPA